MTVSSQDFPRMVFLYSIRASSVVIEGRVVRARDSRELRRESILYLKWHDKVAVAVFPFIFRETSDDDRGEGRLVLHTDIVFAYRRKRLEEVLSIDPDDILLSLD